MVNSSQVRKLFKKFSSYRVLIVGDVMIDSYMFGKVERISPEAPIPIVTSTHKENRLGGAANVALNIKSLGATPLLCSVIGKDEKADVLLKRMEVQGIPPEGLVQTKKRKTTVKTRVISQHQHLLRVDEEENTPLSASLEKRLLEVIYKTLSQSIDAVIFEDYDKGIITPSIIKHTTELANEYNIPVLVDPKKRNYHQYKNITLFKPNFRELVEGSKIDLDKSDHDKQFILAKKLHKEKNFDLILITLSEAGVFISDGESYSTIPAEVREITDVSGAGDTLIATASLCCAAGLTPFDIASISNLAGGLVCEKSGVVPVNRDDLMEEMLIRVEHDE